MKKIKLTLLVFGALLPLLVVGLSVAPVQAQSGITPGSQPTGITPGTQPTPNNPSGTYVLQDPLGNKNICQLVKTLLDIVMAIGLPVAVLFLVWAGFRFIFARGSSDALGKARLNFMYVIIGIAVFLGAWTLASIIAATVQTLGDTGSIQFCINSRT